MREVSAMFDTMDGAVKEALRSSSPCCAFYSAVCVCVARHVVERTRPHCDVSSRLLKCSWPLSGAHSHC